MKQKCLSTPCKIIKILKLMAQSPVSINEIMLCLEKDDIFVNKETISKYFATLRNFGCTIEKKKNKFYINYPVLSFSDDEMKTLAGFQKTAHDINCAKNYSGFLSFLEKIFTLSSPIEADNYRKISKSVLFDPSFKTNKIHKRYKEKIEALSHFMDDDTFKIKILFENKPFDITPVKFRYFKNSVCLIGYDNKNNVNKIFPLDKISDIKSTPKTCSCTEFAMTTTFKISGRLKHAYKTKEGEIVSDYGDYIVVSNNREDKDELFKRLLKYGRHCEILYPASDRSTFLNMIEKLIEKQLRN